MRILLIETGGWGGICHYTYNLANALSRKGLDVTVLSGKRYELEGFKRDFTLLKRFDHERGYIHNTWELIRTVRDGSFSIIHVQSILSPRKDWLLFYAGRLLRRSIVYTVHNILPHDEGERNAWGVKRAFLSIYRNAIHLIAHSETNKRELVESFGIEERRITVIPHGNYLFILPENLPEKEEIFREFGLKSDERVVLFFGAIRRYKGLDTLLRAFKEVHKKIPTARLLIAGKPTAVGEGPPHEDYIKLAEELGLNGKVIFHFMYVPIEQIYKYFVVADLVVYPYRDTTESGSIQLALAFSKPVVATDVGSFKYAIDNDVNGLIVPAEDERALGGAIIYLLSLNKERFHEMGRNSIKVAKERYDWESIAAQTIALYKGILE